MVAQPMIDGADRLDEVVRFAGIAKRGADERQSDFELLDDRGEPSALISRPAREQVRGQKRLCRSVEVRPRGVACQLT